MGPLLEPHADSEELAASIARMASAGEWKIAVAESLTAGRISCALGAAAGSSAWYAGAVVAYDEEVKYRTLGVDRGPVVTAACAMQMARGVADLLGADAAVAVTGAGGPDPQDGQPVGTVFTAVLRPHGQRVDQSAFAGEPNEVVDAATRTALHLLATELAQVV